MEQKQDEKIVDRLISEIERDVSERVERIVQQANSKAQHIISNAKETAQQILDSEKEKAQQMISTIRQKAEASIKMEIRKSQLRLKKEFADTVIEKVRQMGANFRSDSGYKNFLKNVILETIEVIGMPVVIIRFSSLDAEYFGPDFEKEINEVCKKELKKTVVVRFVKDEFQDIGVIGMSEDGFIVYDNTFSARLKRQYEEIYSSLIGEEI